MPYVDASHYQHPLDKQTLDALKAIPGFTALLKAFMKAISERTFYITNNSTHVRLGPDQAPEIYEMLPPLCEKLGIAVPQLYIENRRDINAYTYGDTNPFVVLHSGTLECCSTEQIRTIIAHECGHIANRHTLYHTMGRVILSGAVSFLPGIGALVTAGIQIAFMAWMRASEYSADRAAALAMGGSDPVVDMCLAIAGGYDTLGLNLDKGKFLEQAAQYEQEMKGSFANKFFEVYMYCMDADHPLNAYRALEVVRWCETDEFKNMRAYLEQEALPAGAPFGTPMGLPGNPDTMPRFCNNCGATLAPGSKFCGSCGSKVGA